MNPKFKQLLINMKLNPQDYEQTEYIETQTIYTPIKCEEHNGQSFDCTECLSQNLKRKRIQRFSRKVAIS